MFRLRTTTAWSVLALVVGIAGTVALSAQTSHWAAAPVRMAQAGVHARAHPLADARTHSMHRLAAAHVLHHSMPVTSPSHEMPRRVVETAGAETEPLTLQPLAMPATATPFRQLRDHLDGRVVLQLDVDGEGRVRSAAASQSSGDAVLDAYALRMVRGWRFAVPAGHPEGIHGELPMRFDSVDQLAGAR